MYRERAAATHTQRKGRAARKGPRKLRNGTFPLSSRTSHALRENVDLACLTSVCDAEQLYTDAVFVLDASPREAAASGSGAIVINLHFMHNHTIDF
mgnify:CR=1 FL=1